MSNPLEGTTINRGYMFHAEIFVDGIFSHVNIGGKSKHIQELKALHGFTWKPPILTRPDIRELCPELTKEQAKVLKKELKAQTKEKYKAWD